MMLQTKMYTVLYLKSKKGQEHLTQRSRYLVRWKMASGTKMRLQAPRKRDRGHLHCIRLSVVPIPRGKVDQKAFPFPNLNSPGNNDTQHTVCHLQR